MDNPLNKHQHRFDRQLRLWGMQGQDRLEKAHVLVIGATPTASETLKNLILANVAEFTIMDDSIVTFPDIGNDFFIPPDSLGKHKAKVLVEHLSELNPRTKGHAMLLSPRTLFDLSFLSSYSLVVLCNASQSLLLSISSYLFPLNIPLLQLHCTGFTGIARLAIREHNVLETHPEHHIYDLSLHPTQLKHWPELSEYLFSFDLACPDLQQHSHIPFVAILAQLLRDWTQTNPMPTTSQQTRQFKAFIKQSARDYAQQLNFQQAHQYAHLAYTHPLERTSEFVNQALEMSAQRLQQEPDNPFWVLVNALDRFVKLNQCFPVVNHLPDMTTLPQHYTRLKDMFKTRQEYDTSRLMQLCPTPFTDTAYMNLFVTNCSSLRSVHYRSLDQEYSADPFFRSAVEQVLQESLDMESPHPSGVEWYLGFRAFLKLQEDESRSLTGPEDMSALRSIAVELCQRWRISVGHVNEAILQEFMRSPIEFHPMSAFMGGLGSQACLKVITQQYVPFQNTIVYNGVHSVLDTLSL